MSEESNIALIDKALMSLGEHFDTVHIFATKNSDNNDGTVSVQKGSGNWFARYGQVVNWVNKQDEYDRIKCRAEEEEES